jgi:hypothetical protein
MYTSSSRIARLPAIASTVRSARPSGRHAKALIATMAFTFTGDRASPRNTGETAKIVNDECGVSKAKPIDQIGHGSSRAIEADAFVRPLAASGAGSV